ncbi:NUDIX domain-containing protein [Streptomyces sp. NPDC101132]|uniref:NUDIX domain-containing protein n=1 Tax=Streptomyces sp. NPDC101132 TaxID=3366110 RepID=UPI003809AC12
MPEPRSAVGEAPFVHVRFEGGRLVVERGRGGAAACWVLPGGAERAGDGRLSLEEALHASIRPVGTAETVLRGWVRGVPPAGPVPVDDPTVREPVRVRAGAIVIRDGHALLIGFEGPEGWHYEIPGGGVEAGETPEQAAVRELREETGLRGTVLSEAARVWKDGRREHYFAVRAEGLVLPAGELDNYGGTPTWVPVPDLPATPLWPRRLSWRIAHWHTAGFPARPIELADSIGDLRPPCAW